MKLRLGRESRGYLVAGCAFFLVLEAMLYAAIVWWPNFRENPGAAKQLSGPMEMLADIIDFVELVGVPGYVIAQHFFKGCNTLGTAAAVLFAVGAIAGEAHRGTLEIWLARPVTRLRLYGERYAKGLLAVIVPIFLTSLTVPFLLERIDETMRYDDLMRCSVQQALFLGCLYTSTFAISAYTSAPLRLGIGMLFLVIFQFAIYLVNSITHTSIFRLVDVETYAIVLNQHELDPVINGGMAAFCAVTFWIGYVGLKRRVP
jgi:ABC-type transport system involved in multi-copper enzyme maturation permease subunit